MAKICGPCEVSGILKTVERIMSFNLLQWFSTIAQKSLAGISGIPQWGCHWGLLLSLLIILMLISRTVAKAMEHSFVLKCEAGCRPPVCWGSSVGFNLSALQSDVMKRHFLHALGACHLAFMFPARPWKRIGPWKKDYEVMKWWDYLF